MQEIINRLHKKEKSKTYARLFSFFFPIREKRIISRRFMLIKNHTNLLLFDLQ